MSEAIEFSTGQPSTTAFRMSFPTVDKLMSGKGYERIDCIQPLPISSKIALGFEELAYTRVDGQSAT
jgi:hypothetical protein